MTDECEGAATRTGGTALCRLLVVSLLLCGVPAPATAQDPPSEHEVKAVFLYNFAKFVSWPPGAFPNPETSVVLCIVGADPFGSLLESTTRGETVEGRAIELRRLTVEGDLRSCHILFVSSSERRRLGRVLEALDGASVLTVGEMDDFAELGGIVRFTKERYRIGIEVNIEAAERANLKISSRLLSLALVVRARGGSARLPR